MLSKFIVFLKGNIRIEHFVTMKKVITKSFPILLLLATSLLCINKKIKAEIPELIPYLINDFEIQNQNWSITQNPKSQLVYIANSEGLAEFNGISWKKYTLNDGPSIRSVAADSLGRIFTGSFEDFGYWDRNALGELEYKSLAHLTEIEKNDEIWKIYTDDKNVYFQSFTSIYIFRDNKILKAKAPYAMLFMHEVNEKYVVQVIERGLFWFEDNEFKRIENSDIFETKKVHAIVPYNTNQWLVCTDNHGIYHYDGQAFNYFTSDASTFLQENVCNVAKQLNDTTYAFGSILNGLIITNREGEILRRYNVYNGLQNNTVLSLHTDQNAGLWIGLDEGVNYINLNSPYTHYKSRNASFGTIYALHKYENKLYIGTNRGLFRSDIEKKAEFYQFTNLKLIEDSQGQVWSLEEFENQILCGHNDGIFLVSDERLMRISAVTGGWAFKRFGEHLLVGTYTGIVVLKKSDEGLWQYHTKVEGFQEPTRYIEVDYLGYVWASHHQKGLYRIKISDDLSLAEKVDYYPNINGKSYNIKVSKINNSVIFTTSENIYTYDYVRDQIIPIDSLSRTLGEYRTANQIQHFRKHEYWLIKDDKLALFDINIDFSATKRCEIQLNNLSLPQRSIELVTLDSTTLIIPTPESFDTYNLTLDKSNQRSMGLELEKVLFYGQRDDVVTHYKPSTNLKTKWNMNNVTISYIAPYSFDLPNKYFLYRIKELDSNWQSTHNNQITYLGLKYGDYTIEVQGPDGSRIQIPFRVEKPWYYSEIALSAYALAFIIIIWLIVLYFKYKLIRQNERLGMELRQSSLERELDTKSYELMLTIRYLINKNEILTELQNEVNAIKEHSSKYPIKNLRSMERIITEGLDNQTEDWKNAMNSLKLSQQGFFKKLMEQYPKLTPNDLRLCSYLRMNFSTKEIARLLNNSPRAIEISRYRLRKKMNLDHDINLSEFLMSEIFSENIKNSQSV
jgi:ligand-binding sensor domain-containing protein/DNA-binding CsgD family transcriptional regulator